MKLATPLLLLLCACAQEPRDPVAAFVEHYIESDLKRPFEPTFLGVPTWQNPCDLWMLQEIIAEVKPDVVIETGTAYGGSALFLAMVLEQVNPQGRVITIDVEPKTDAAARLRIWRERVDLIVGDSVGEDTIAELERRVKGKTVLLTLDSLHGRNHVLEELRRLSHLVSKGSYVVVQDTVIDRKPEWIERYASYDGSTAGPGRAVEEFLQENRAYEVDPSRERFLFTFHPRGFLKRVR